MHCCSHCWHAAACETMSPPASLPPPGESDAPPSRGWSAPPSRGPPPPPWPALPLAPPWPPPPFATPPSAELMLITWPGPPLVKSETKRPSPPQPITTARAHHATGRSAGANRALAPGTVPQPCSIPGAFLSHGLRPPCDSFVACGYFPHAHYSIFEYPRRAAFSRKRHRGQEITVLYSGPSTKEPR